MQVNPILNLLLPSATGGQASPLNFLAGQDGVPGMFTGMLGQQAGNVNAEGLDAASLLESLNPESGGIVPVPLVNGTVPPQFLGEGGEMLSSLQAKLQYISQRDGRVPAGVVSGLKNSDLAQQTLPSKVENVATLPMNELANDEDFQLKSEFTQLFENNKGEGKGVSLALENVTKAASAQAAEEALNQLKAKLSLAPASQVPEGENPDDYIIVKDIPKSGKNVSATQDKNSEAHLAALMSKSGSEVKNTSAFTMGNIDANEEVLVSQRFGTVHDSRLETQIRIAEHQQPLHHKSPVEQVSVKVIQAAAEGLDKIRIKLHPAELGKVSVEMDVREEGKTQVRIIADKSDTLELLRRDHADLSRALREIGIKTDNNGLEFSLRGQNSQNGQEFGGAQNGTNSNGQEEMEEASFSQIDEYTKYGSLNEQELVLNISQQGLDIVA